MKVLVVGANGFIGRHLCDGLLRDNCKVKALVRRAHQFLAAPNLEVITGDILKLNLDLLLDSVTHIVYLVSQSIPSRSLIDPSEDFVNDVLPLVSLLERLKTQPEIHFTYLSSGGAVYGHGEEEKINETSQLNPLSFYGAIKVSCEKFLNVYSQIYKHKILILRPANIYGPGQRTDGAQGLIPFLCQKLIAKESFPMFGDGKIYRDYLYVTDFVEALQLSLKKNLVGIFNVSSSEGRSINEIIEIVNNLGMGEVSIQHLPNRRFDVAKVFLNSDKIRSAIEWTPQVGLEDGIRSTFEFIYGEHVKPKAA